MQQLLEEEVTDLPDGPLRESKRREENKSRYRGYEPRKIKTKDKRYISEVRDIEEPFLLGWELS
ncbi:MAG TPA: hypothetical protein PK016_08295 [Candidatus Atribacteria bacterium]|nr:hypothetical protein [Candidatus Atribacteria bacterium]